MGTFLFRGPTGVGKTETAKALAEIYFGSEQKMIRLDMSEFQAISDIPRLIGATSPVEMQGLLTTPVRETPFSLVLLDEVEKAHPNILNLFLQVLDEGHITDGQGRKMSKSLGNTIAPQEVTEKMGAEIVRLWVAATDYSGDLNIDAKILARVVDTYRRVRNTLKFLLANVSDFNPANDSVPDDQLLEIDRYAIARAARLQEDILRHYAVYEFHPVVSKLQVYCSEDLGAFYLDILKDRLYTTATTSLARRSAQTALWQITQGMLHWMAPFLSFTAEEAWSVLSAAGKNPVEAADSIFLDTYVTFGPADDAVLAKWGRIREIREAVNKEIETLRAAGLVGASLQAEVTITVPAADFALLTSLGTDLKFVFITSTVTLEQGPELAIQARASVAVKCDRCWHYQADVGADADHATLCGRCVSNLFGPGEVRSFV
jgi:isoleucyl-tRNA synthetase